MFDIWQGPLMDAAGDSGGGGGVAVADAASDYGGDSGADAGAGEGGGEVHDAEFVEQPTELAEQRGQEQEPSTALVKSGERAVQNGKFTQSGRAAIEALRPLSPKLAQEVTQALLTRDWFLKEFPGGKKEIAQLRELAQSNGGEQGIGELKRTVSLFNELDEFFSASDPRFWDKVTETDNERRALVGLMGSALEKFQKLSPQQFAYHQAKAFSHLMDSARLPVTFARMADLLNRAGAYDKAGNHEIAASLLAEITQTYNEIADTLDKVYALSKTPPQEQRANDPQIDQRAQQLTQREQALQKQEWETTVSNERRRLFAKSWAEVTKGRTLNSDQESTVKGFYELRMSTKIKQWQNQAQRFFQNGDKDGYLREQFAFFQKAIPDALRQAVQQAIPAKPGPKPAGGPGKLTVNRGVAPAGVIKVAKMPPTSDLDAVRTTSAMISANQAYRKSDGRLVQWT